jgi:acyl-coenzyme A thioesterase PaaI-like protein
MEVRGEQGQLVASGSGTFTVTSAIIQDMGGA